MVGCHACTPNQQRGNPFINDGGVSRLQHHINDGVTLCSNMQAAPIIDGGVSTLAPLHPHGGLPFPGWRPEGGAASTDQLAQGVLHYRHRLQGAPERRSPTPACACALSTPLAKRVPLLPLDRQWGIRRRWGRGHRDRNRVYAGPPAKASGGRVAASTLEGAPPPQDPLWRTREGVGPSPQGQKPGLLRPRRGGAGVVKELHQHWQTRLRADPAAQTASVWKALTRPSLREEEESTVSISPLPSMLWVSIPLPSQALNSALGSPADPGAPPRPAHALCPAPELSTGGPSFSVRRRQSSP
ncbi:uncharacterized protein LOC144229674 [Crocuta crocuta]